ncbi:MAG: hypothetical protein DPW14_04500 [Planctomycetes bacterium]|nr:hypothetical protein [Planctomycetota bacterium]
MSETSYKPTEGQVAAAIEASGFPFQLEVAAKVKGTGWAVEPFRRFYSEEREKDVEIDVFATRWLDGPYNYEGTEFKCQISLGIECKASDLPYVCLGIDYAKPVGPEQIDPDAGFTHVFSTRQTDRNQWSIPLFDSNRPGIAVKEGHLHFGAGPRYRAIVGTEWKGSGDKRYLKAHAPEEVNYDISRLGWFIEDFHEKYESLNRQLLEESQKAVIVAFPFTALVLRDAHYRYDIGTRAPALSSHTPVFVNRDFGESSLKYVVDVVAAPELPALLAKYEATAQLMLKQTAAWIAAHKNKWGIA